MLLSAVVLQTKMIMLKEFSKQSYTDNTLLGINHTLNKNDIFSTILIMLPSLARISTFL